MAKNKSKKLFVLMQQFYFIAIVPLQFYFQLTDLDFFLFNCSF